MFRRIILVSLLPIITLTGCAKKDVQQDLEQTADESSKAIVNDVATTGQQATNAATDVVNKAGKAVQETVTDTATKTATATKNALDTAKNKATEVKEVATKEVVELADNIAGGAETVVAGGDKVIDVNEPAEEIKIDASQQY